MSRRAWWLLVLACQLGAVARAQDEEEGEDQPYFDGGRCMLGGEQGRIVIEHSAECDGWRCPSRWEKVRVYGPDNRRLLSTSQSYDYDDAPDPFDVRCKDGQVVLEYTVSPPETFHLVYDQKENALALPPELECLLGNGLNAPASTERLMLLRLASEAFRVLLEPRRLPPPNAASNALQPPLNRVLGLDEHVQQYLELLLAQESIRAGAWLDAAAILGEGAEGPWSGPHRARFDFWRGTPRLHFDPEWQGLRHELLDQLARLRADSRPLDVVERRRIGRAVHVLATPLDPGKRAALFWRGHDLCMVQAGDPPSSMKCYDPARRRWGAASPVEWPKLDGMLLEEPRPKPKDYSGQPIVAARATALIAASSGSRAVGQGCCWLEPEHGLLVELDGSQRSWELIGAPPRAESWVGSALASPDQSWVALQSKGSADEVSIWLLRVAPHQKH